MYHVYLIIRVLIFILALWKNTCKRCDEYKIKLDAENKKI